MIAVAARRLSSLTVVLDNLWSAHNFSAIVRTAEALGLCEAHVVEALSRYRSKAGVTHGADRWLPVRRHGSFVECRAKLRDAGFLLACADVGEGCVELGHLPCDRPLAIVLGSEKHGLSEAARSGADLRFTVPMAGFTESFNVSVSAAISLFHVEQRMRERLARRGLEGELAAERAAAMVAAWIESTRARRRRTHR
ncbi:MAG: TrmH family RNA methyltransferase [Acidobacteria bacterium]|nr:MAG: TrmH family RNA methyltransferase [Acidobacteriota bacterium]REK00257.1 MAG: TrmH family RNA methyltransferase [Acidobacteriota bacterium]